MNNIKKDNEHKMNQQFGATQNGKGERLAWEVCVLYDRMS